MTRQVLTRRISTAGKVRSRAADRLARLNRRASLRREKGKNPSPKLTAEIATAEHMLAAAEQALEEARDALERFETGVDFAPPDEADTHERALNRRMRERILREAGESEGKAERQARAKAQRAAAGAPDRKTRDRIRRALATLKRLARHARGRLVRRQAEERRRVLAELRAKFRAERAELRAKFRERAAAIRVLGIARVERRRQLLATQRELEQAHRASRRAEEQAIREEQIRRRAVEMGTQSDETVEREIEAFHPEWLPLWRKVRGTIKRKPGRTRVESFFHYAEEHPTEALAALDNGQDAWIREQEAKLYREHGIAPPGERKAAKTARAKRPIDKGGRPWWERLKFQGRHWPAGLVRMTNDAMRQAAEAIEHGHGETSQGWRTVARWLGANRTRHIWIIYDSQSAEIMRFEQKERGKRIHVDRKGLFSAPEHVATVAYRFIHLEVEDSSDPPARFVEIAKREAAQTKAVDREYAELTAAAAEQQRPAEPAKAAPPKLTAAERRKLVSQMHRDERERDKLWQKIRAYEEKLAAGAPPLLRTLKNTGRREAWERDFKTKIEQTTRSWYHRKQNVIWARKRLGMPEEDEAPPPPF